MSALWTSLMGVFGIKPIHTTSYHPPANGIVERMHRQLKTSLKTRLSNQVWMEQLPIVLLGMRAALKEDIGCSSAELVFGTLLRLPGELWISENDNVDPLSLAGELCKTFSKIQPTSTKNHGKPSFYVPRNLSDATQVFVRHNVHRAPLQRPYDGPFRVLQEGDKVLKVDFGTRKDFVSIDRLKPAYIETSEEFEMPSTKPTPTMAKPTQTPNANVSTYSGPTWASSTWFHNPPRPHRD